MYNFMIVPIAIALYPGFLFYLCRWRWKKVLYHRPNAKFQYHITDIWAFSLGMMVSIGLSAYMIKHLPAETAAFSQFETLMTGCVIFLFSASQIAGAALGHIEGELNLLSKHRYWRDHPTHQETVKPEHSAWMSAFFIVLGSLFGLILPVLYFFGVFFVVLCVMLCIVGWPVTVVLLAVWYFGRYYKKYNRKIKPVAKLKVDEKNDEGG